MSVSEYQKLYNQAMEAYKKNKSRVSTAAKNTSKTTTTKSTSNKKENVLTKKNNSVTKEDAERILANSSNINKQVSSMGVAQPDYENERFSKSQADKIIEEGQQALKERQKSFDEWYTEDKKDMLFNADGTYRDLRAELDDFKAKSNTWQMTAKERHEYNAYKKELETAIEHSDYLQAREQEKNLTDIEDTKKFYTLQDAYNDTFAEKVGKQIGIAGANILNMPFQAVDVVRDVLDPNFDISNPNNISNQIQSAIDAGEYENDVTSKGLEKAALMLTGTTIDFGTHVLLQMATGIPVVASMGTESGLNKYYQNRQEGYDEETSLKNAVLTGVLTGVAENIGMDNLSKRILGNGLGKITLSAIATQALSEGFEEAFEYGMSPIVDFATLGKKPHYEAGELLQSVLLGMASGGIIGAGGNAVSAVKTQKQANIIKREMKFLTDIRNNSTFTDVEERVYRQAMAHGNFMLKNFTDSSVLNGAVQFESDLVQPLTLSEAMNNLNQAMQPQVDMEMRTYQEQMAISNMVQASQTLLQNKGINMDATQYTNLDEDTRKQVDNLQKLSRDLNQTVIFDSEMYADDGSVIDGYYDNATGRIVINPKGNNPAMSTFVHELTHGTESSKVYNRLKDLVIASNNDYAQGIENIKNAYKKVTDLDNEGATKEYVAIKLQEQLGNEDFVKRLVKYDTSLAHRIYEGVKKLVFNTNTNQDIEYYFMKAFRDSGINSEQEAALQYSFKMKDGSELVMDSADELEQAKKVVEMEPVYDIKQNQFAKNPNKNLVEMATEYFDSFGNIVYRDDIGEIVLDGKGAKSLIAHYPRYQDKYAAIEALPTVIERGKIINSSENWKGRNKDTIVICAPVSINNSKKYMSVVVEQDEFLDNKYYVHELIILDQEYKKNSANSLNKTQSFSGTELTEFTYNILKKAKNNKYSIGLSSQDLSSMSNEELEQIQNELLSEEKMTPQSFNYYLKTVDDMTVSKEEKLERINLIESNIGTSLLKKKAFERYKYVYSTEKYNTYKEYRAEQKRFEEERSAEFAKRLQEQLEAREKEHERNLKLAEEMKLTPEEHLANAKKIFGVTSNFASAGYITTDGNLLNFGDKKYGRGSDHRVISAAFNPEELYDKNSSSGVVALIKFLNEGNIRIVPETNGLDLRVMPTQSQIKKIKEFINSVRGQEFMVDISNEKGNVVKSFSYDKANIKDVLNDITNHFSKNHQYSIGLTKDNLGRNLSEEQKNYFANTKVKDENGNLQVMYRGGNEEINVFDNKKSRASNLYGRGFYFTADESHAAQYGQARPYYLNIENPLSLDDHNISKDEIVKLLQGIEDDGEDYDLSNYGYGATPESIANDIYGKSDFDMLQDISATAVGDLVYTTKWFNELNGTNYDGFILPTETVVFDSNQIKNVDNTSPTTNADIRYSVGLSTEDVKKRGASQALKYFVGSFNEKSWLNTKHLSNDIYTYLSDAEQQIKENGNVTDETKTKIKDALWKSFVIEKTDESAKTMIQDQKAIRKFMKSGSLSIESIGGHSKDFTEFRNKNFGNFTFTKNGGRGVDTVYQELLEQYPHYFDESITHPADQIKAIAEFLNTKHEAKQTVHLGSEGLETEEFEAYFDESFNKYIRTVKNKEIADDVNSSIKKSSTPEEVRKRAITDLKSKYSDLNPVLVDKAIDEVQNIGYVSEATKGALKDDFMQFFGDETIFRNNPKARNRIHDFINETVEHFATKGQYESDMDFANSVASKVNKLLKGYAGISNEDIDNLYDEVSTIKKADALLKEKRNLNMLNYTDLVDELIFKGKDAKGYMSQIERVLDKTADGDVELRTKLREVLEFPRYQAQIQYVKSLKKYNSTIEQIVKTGIREGSKESKAVQWLMEKQREDGSSYTNADLYKEFNYKMKNGKMACENIENAAKLLRRDYDDMYQTIDGIRKSIYGDVELKNDLDTKELQAKFEIARENLNKIQSAVQKNPTAQNQRVYAAALNEYKLLSRQLSTKLDENASGDSTRRQDLKYRENYAHRTYEKESVFLKLIKERVGVKEVPTKLAGVSDYAQPKTGYASFFKKRVGGSYEADALKGFAEYIQDASRIIAYDPLIEHYRDFTSALQNTAKDDTMSQFTRYLINYTNSLAGKTNPIDRPVRELMGDTLFGVFKEINNRVKANAILGNLKTSVTQLANAPMAAGMLVKNGGSGAVTDLTKGSFNYLTSLFNGKGDKSNLSPFIQARFFDTDTDAVGIGAKVDNMFNFLLTKGDEVVTKMLWNSAYEQALRKNVDSPIFYADDLTRRTVAGRGHGEVPVALQSQVLNFVIPFQVETTNTMNNFIDMAKDPKSWTALLFALLGDFFFNELFEKITGSRPLFDPIDVVRNAVKNEEDLGTASGHMAGEMLGATPYGSMVPSLFGMDSYETEALFGDSDPTRYGTGNIGLSAIKDVASSVVDGKPLDAASDVVANFVLPGGGKQAQRTIEALQANGMLPQYVNGEWVFSPAYYKSNGKVGYETLPETILDSASNLGNFAKQVAFGKWAGKEAQEYLNGGSSSQTSSKAQSIIDWFTSNDESVSKNDAMAITEEIELAKDGFTSSNPKAEFIEWMDEKGYTAEQKNAIFDTYYGDGKQVINLNEFSTDANLSQEQTYKLKEIIFTSEGKKAANKIDTIRNSKALEVRKKLDEIGLYDEYLNYVLDNDLELSSMGLNKKVAKMTNEEFESEYSDIFGTSYKAKTDEKSLGDIYAEVMNSSKSKKSSTSKTKDDTASKIKKIDSIVNKARTSSSTTSDSKVDAILEKLKNNSSNNSTAKATNSELLKRYLKEHAYDTALFD